MLCPIPGCPTKAPPRGVVCPIHWQLVPMTLRTDVNALFDPGKHPEDQQASYLSAAAAAVEAAAKRWRSVMQVPRIKALTLHRPWAWLIAAGHKPLENRSWAPPASMVGQRMAIHAGQEIDKDGALFVQQEFRLELPADAWQTGVVALATIDRLFTDSAKLPTEPLCESPWYSGKVAWVLRDVVRIPAVESSGMQGLWSLSEDVAKTVWYRYHAGLAARE